MPVTQPPPTGCPPGLEYLSVIDQLIVKQQIELLEGRRSRLFMVFNMSLNNYDMLIIRNNWDEVFKSGLSKFSKGCPLQDLLKPILNTSSRF